MRVFVLFPVLLARGLAADCPAPPPDRETAQAHLLQLEHAGQEAFERRDFAGAAVNLRQAICFAPTEPRVWHELGLAEAAAGNFAGADAALSKAEHLAPHNFGVLLSHAQVQLSLNKPDLASRTLHQARQSQPEGSPAALRALGRLYAVLGRAWVESKQQDLALAAFLRAREAGPLDAETLLLLSTLENTQGAYADAVEDAQRVRDGGAGMTDAQKSAAAAIAGLACKNQKRDEDAIRLLREATRLSPNPTSYLALAEIYENAGELSEAIAVLDEARAVLPDSVKVAVALGRNLANSGDGRRAVEVLREVTTNHPGEPEAWRWLAEAQNSLGETAAAIAALEEIARRAPDYPMIDVMIAQALLKADPVDYPKALHWLDRAEKTAPSDPDVYYMRGKIYAAQDRYQDAIAPLRRAIELAPTAALSYYQLGLVYRKLNRPAEAAQQFDRFAFFKTEVQ